MGTRAKFLILSTIILLSFTLIFYGTNVAIAHPMISDFGDAPDGVQAGYFPTFITIIPGVGTWITTDPTGLFPSFLNTQNTSLGGFGIHHHNTPMVTEHISRSGVLPTFESDSIQIDNDADNASFLMFIVLVSAPPPASLTIMDVHVPTGAPSGTRFVNVLMDMNMNGRWEGTSTHPGEWVISNEPVFVPPGGSTTFTSDPFGFGASEGFGRIPRDWWTRATITDQPISGSPWDGSGQFSTGETEDVCFNWPGYPTCYGFLPFPPPPPPPPPPGESKGIVIVREPFEANLLDVVKGQLVQASINQKLVDEITIKANTGGIPIPEKNLELRTIVGQAEFTSTGKTNENGEIAFTLIPIKFEEGVIEWEAFDPRGNPGTIKGKIYDIDNESKVEFDSDGDGISDKIESSIDLNNDGILDLDVDHDGIENAMDKDSDGDGILDRHESSNDLDSDSIPNFVDKDSDGDGILDGVEGPWFLDIDGDLKGNFIDDDSDGDGILDSEDPFRFDDQGKPDSDGDGISNNMDQFPDNPNRQAIQQDYTIDYEIKGGAIVQATPNGEKKSLLLELETTEDGVLDIKLPRTLIDAKLENGGDDVFFVLIDGEESDFEEIVNADDRMLSIHFQKGAKQIEIFGTFAVPEFGTITMMILAVSIINIIAVTAKSRVILRL